MTVALATAASLPAMDQDEAALLAALDRVGVPAEEAVWNDPGVDWSAYELVVIRSTWDYTADREAYVAWARRVGAVTTLYNSADVVEWNTHKRYLIELEDRGAPVVPTAWTARGDRVDLAALLDDRGWSRAVVKPAVGAGAEGLFVVRGRRDVAEGQRRLDALLGVGDAMIQPFVDEVSAAGELSVVVIDGEVTHAVRKRPRPGDVRIQIEHGGEYEVEEPSADAAALARWIVEATGHDLLYARVDLLPDGGGWALSELEATEPSLYLAWSPAGAEALARAIAARR